MLLLSSAIDMKEILLNNGVREIHLPITFNSAAMAEREFKLAAKLLESAKAHVVSLEVSAGSFADFAAAKFCEGSQFPSNRILPLVDAHFPVLAGAHITAVAGTLPKFARSESGARSAFYSDGVFDYCRTFGVVSKVDNALAYEHTLDNLRLLEKALEPFGFSYADIARTWFYNDDILSWYADFNRARTDFYKERKIFDKLLPASTGIGAPNPSGAKIISGALAVRKIGRGEVSDVNSPMQCGAPNYGSSFARAVEIESAASSRVLVSGTASIDFGGKTAHVGDIAKQVDLTMQVIEAILKERAMTLSDTVRSVIYCLKPEYYAEFLRWEKRNGGIAHFPSYSIVCRDDLLFEVELEAAKNR